jgi:hypothetical protein
MLPGRTLEYLTRFSVGTELDAAGKQDTRQEPRFLVIKGHLEEDVRVAENILQIVFFQPANSHRRRDLLDVFIVKVFEKAIEHSAGSGGVFSA